ncbi:MAG: hypothetical protein U9Q94_05015 [Candidatus Bipolaricaulota bacterium]|nr:hypothetical protein [Candidatus Bipolaricaulota bacterium]
MLSTHACWTAIDLLVRGWPAVVLPTLSEIQVLGYDYIPLAWILLFAVLGKMVGAYILFLVGARAKETPRFQRFLDRHH